MHTRMLTRTTDSGYTHKYLAVSSRQVVHIGCQPPDTFLRWARRITLPHTPAAMDSGVLSATPVHACTGFRNYRYTLVKGGEGAGSRIHSRAGNLMKLRGEDGTREACSAACSVPVLVRGSLCYQHELPCEQPAGSLQLGVRAAVALQAGDQRAQEDLVETQLAGRRHLLHKR